MEGELAKMRAQGKGNGVNTPSTTPAVNPSTQYKSLSEYNAGVKANPNSSDKAGVWRSYLNNNLATARNNYAASLKGKDAGALLKEYDQQISVLLILDKWDSTRGSMVSHFKNEFAGVAYMVSRESFDGGNTRKNFLSALKGKSSQEFYKTLHSMYVNAPGSKVAPLLENNN